ncbi:MAG: ethanolamine utilization protein EutJ [Propionibacteriaceae bacterium]|nr:ethanolamine utilization protein EutJ [Propionibacteriaceae bacterium]
MLTPARLRTLECAVEALHTTTPLPKGTPVKCGVDLGTASIIVVALDPANNPVAAEMQPCQVARDGLVVDYHGAIQIVQRLTNRLRERLDTDIRSAAIAVPPGTAPANAATHRYVTEAADLDVLSILDEPTAANSVLGIANGAVVDIGGGTTGVSIFEDSKVVYTADEPTGGTHMSLVLMGRLGLDYEQAEAMKQDPAHADEVRQAVRPVAEKMATIVGNHLRGRDVEQVWLVGGAAGLKGIEDIFTAHLGIPTHKPPNPMMVTPVGIAMNVPLEEEPC